MTPYFTQEPEITTNKRQIVVLCDHAHNTVPVHLPPALGLPPHEMERHIAYDIGAAGVSRAMAAQLSAAIVMSNFSRLVIDPNRGEDDPTMIMQLYDGSIIPANRGVTAGEIETRRDTLYRPYHTEVARVLSSYTAPIVVSVHTFTPQLRGRASRPWEVGVLYNSDTRLSDSLMTELSAETDLTVGDNQPYTGRLQGDTMEKHALNHGRLHVLIEIRNDLIETETQQNHWADRLSPILLRAIDAATSKGSM
jgi:predicted N-formylglutamate amidohydrolase